MRFLSFTILILACINTLNVYAQKPQETSLDASIVTIGNIYITGNEKTREEIIRRELDFKEGDVFKKADLLETIVRDQQKLNNTRLFTTVEVVPLMMSDTNADILIRLQERWYIFPVPIFQLADRNFTEWWVNQKRDFSRVNWGLQVYHMNLTGRNDRLVGRLQFGFTKNVALRYTLPYIDKNQKLGISAGVSYSNNKTVGITSSGHRQVFFESANIVRDSFRSFVTFTYRPSFYSVHSLDLGYSRMAVADSVALLNPGYLNNSRVDQQYLRLSYQFSVDKRDFISYPLKGSVFMANINQFGLGVFKDLNMLTTRVSYSKFFDLGKKFYQANQVEVYKNFSRPIPYARRAGFGYRPNFIRGYERYVIESDFLISYRTSVKFKFIDGAFSFDENSVVPQFRTVPYAFFFKAFVDAGYSGNPLTSTENNFYNNNLIGSIGIGLDIVTYYDFVMRLEYSINREGNTGFYFNFGRAL